MSKIGQIRLKKEFDLFQLLQQDSRVDGIITIEYNPPASGDPDKWVSIMVRPKDGLYPHRFRITYCMPMYVGPGRLVRDWHVRLIVNAPESVLLNPHSDNNVELCEGFPCGVPFNNHVGAGWICSGSAWARSIQLGLWCFVLYLGCLLNLDPIIMADEPHLNAEAYHWWVEQRHRKPTNDIQWPFDLIERAERNGAVRFGEAAAPPRITFGATRKPSIRFSNTR